MSICKDCDIKMPVTYTPNIGLAKPSESELAQDWVNTQKWAEDNNLIVAAKSNFPLKSYTPTMIASVTNPSYGSGGIYGEYLEFQGWIFGSFSMYFLDPGVSAGSGTGGYGIRLPTLADISFHNAVTFVDGIAAASVIGEGYFSDLSSVTTSGVTALELMRINGIDYVRQVPEPYTGKTTQWVGPGVPVAAAHGDGLSGSFVYKKG